MDVGSVASRPQTLPVMRFSLRTLALCLALTACADRASREGAGGTVIVGAAADADFLIPGLVRGVVSRAASELLFDRLADIGPGLSTVGDAGFDARLAHGWSWSPDSLAITFRIDPKARWHDGTPVRSGDYAFALRLVRAPETGSQLAADASGIDSVSTPDAATVVVHFKRRDPEQFYAATLVVPVPEHVYGTIPFAEFATHPSIRNPVGSGRYRFVAWEPDVRLELAANDAHYRGRPTIDRVIFAKSANPATGLARVWAGETDLWEPLTPDLVPEAQRHEHVRVVTGPGYDYGFVAFNFREPGREDRPHALFANQALRRALSMAIDREAIRRTLFDSLAAVGLGPFVRAQSTADTTIRQIPFDRAAAAAALDSLGWRAGRDGIRVRAGRPLRFAVLVPTSSAVRNRAAVLLQQQWKEVGVEMRIESVEFQTMQERLTAGRFDATIGAWRTTPSPRGIRSTWGSPAIAGASRQNAGRYANPAFDEAVTAGLQALDATSRRAHLSRAYQTIVDDAAAIFLYEVRNIAAVHRRYRIPAWRSEAWWLTLGDWTVDPAQRLPRDAPPTP